VSYDFFSDDELMCKCGCGQALMDDAFMGKLVSLRELAGFAFHLTSAYRCPIHNHSVSSTGMDGPHTTGRAVDIALFGPQAHWVITNAGMHGMTGIGINQKGDYTSRIVHLDDLPNGSGQPRPWVWTY
jgi:zinc D-Ala-D-Ala carboxypeptidase